MRLCRVAPDGLYAVLHDDGSLEALYSDPFRVPLGSWELGRPLPSDPLRLLSPVAPGKIVGVARSYPAHADELGNPRPQEPLFFLKSPGSVIGPGAPIVLPRQSSQVDYEGEVAVVLKNTLRRAGLEEARRSILGITCACDVTARDLQRRTGRFSAAKSFDTFCPLGPSILLEPSLEDIRLRTLINGEIRQNAGLHEMSWSLAELLSQASQVVTLEPGDVLLSGTPAGVGPLQDGDLVEVEVTGVGRLCNRAEAARE